jgi:hypothetical protein
VALREPAFGIRNIAAGLVKAVIDDLLVARHLLAEPVVDGAVRRLTISPCSRLVGLSPGTCRLGPVRCGCFPSPLCRHNIRGPTKPADTISAV